MPRPEPSNPSWTRRSRWIPPAPSHGEILQTRVQLENRCALPPSRPPLQRTLVTPRGLFVRTFADVDQPCDMILSGESGTSRTVRVLPPPTRGILCHPDVVAAGLVCEYVHPSRRRHPEWCGLTPLQAGTHSRITYVGACATSETPPTLATLGGRGNIFPA